MLYVENKEDREVIEMVNRNHHLSTSAARTVGYIVPADEAYRMAYERAAAAGKQNPAPGVVAALASLLVAIVITVLRLGA